MRRAQGILGSLGLVGAVVAAVAAGCGARSDLPVPEDPRSDAFCARADYESGSSTLSIYVLLDKSLSMLDDHKWDLTTAALSAFVSSPQATGLGVGLSYFPQGSACDDAQFAAPAVPIDLLPRNAGAVVASLAAQTPDGTTPMLPALRAAIEHARAVRIGDPSNRVLVALVTDGAPEGCDSTAESVAEAAAAGVSGDPQVLTFVLGLETGYLDALATIAAAGGTGAPIVIGRGGTAAQQIVDALSQVREASTSCTFAVPPTPGAKPAATDIAVLYIPSIGGEAVAIARVDGASSCPAAGLAFYADLTGPAPTITLCPGACATAQATAGSGVAVVAGCGARDAPIPTPPDADGGTCPGIVDFACVRRCGDATSIPVVCASGTWACPEGAISTRTCASCQPVPHGCCKADGTLTDASCIAGAWICPPGATAFGEGACKPPGVCAPTLPCALGDICVAADFSCGGGDEAGSCIARPTTCSGPAAQVCGCDGAVHPSACAAAAQGVDISTAGCPTPPGTFGCGPYFCGGGQVCRTLQTLGVVHPGGYTCVDEPPGCPGGCGCQLCGTCPAGKHCTELCQDDGNSALLMCEQI